MRSVQRLTFVTVVIAISTMAIPGHAKQAAQSEREAMYYRHLEFFSLLKGAGCKIWTGSAHRNLST